MHIVSKVLVLLTKKLILLFGEQWVLLFSPIVDDLDFIVQIFVTDKWMRKEMDVFFPTALSCSKVMCD